MAEGLYRIAIVGASSLAGKELADELGDSLLATSDVLLFEEEVDGDAGVNGTVAAAGDGATVIQAIDESSFERMDFVFFAGDATSTLKHWNQARLAGASIIDLTGALEGQPGVVVRAPLVQAAMGKMPTVRVDFTTTAVVAAAPAAVMIGLIAERIHRKLPLVSLAVTIIEPASEYGREAMDELHQQTVNLLSFQNLPKEQYDAQVAFNMLSALGETANVDLAASAQRIARHSAMIHPELPEFEFLVVHGPVFHGYVASILVEVGVDTEVAGIEGALEGEGIDITAQASDPPSNLAAAGQEDVMVMVRAARPNVATGRRFWLWVAADNLKLGALNAISCANELKRLRPRGKVQ